MTRELHNLSSVCKQTEQELRSHEEEAKNVLQQWQESGQLPSPEILARLITTRDEVMSQSIGRYGSVFMFHSDSVLFIFKKFFHPRVCLMLIFNLFTDLYLWLNT
jgi:hypothetical protein